MSDTEQIYSDADATVTSRFLFSSKGFVNLPLTFAGIQILWFTSLNSVHTQQMVEGNIYMIGTNRMLHWGDPCHPR